MAELQKKIYAQVIKQPNGMANSRDITFVLSDETPDSDGDIIRVAGWDLGRFLTNSICPGFHEYDKFPFGEWRDVRKDFRSPNGVPRLLGTLHFPTIEELCPSGQVTEHAKNVDMACAMVNNGWLNAVSVGCYYKVAEPRTDYPEGTPEWMRGREVKQAELLECSLVPIPSNPNALSQLSADKSIDPKMVEYISKSFKEHAESKSVIPYKKYPIAEESTAWDGPKVVADSEVEDLKKICTWYDGSKDDADLVKGDFKLPHHMTKADGYKTVWKGVAAAYGALMGSRGGVDIPDADKEKCKAHLAKHYLDFNKTVPEDKAAWVEQCKAMGFDDLIEKEASPVVQKIGARLSSQSLAHIDNLEKCVKSMMNDMSSLNDKCNKALDHMSKLKDGADPEETDAPDVQSDDAKSINDCVINIVE
jgi:hypothetical protein